MAHYAAFDVSVSARSAGVHMAVSRRETVCNAVIAAVVSSRTQSAHPSQAGCQLALPGVAPSPSSGPAMGRLRAALCIWEKCP